MVDSRTKLDILYQDALGDVAEILKKVDALDLSINETAEKAVSNINQATKNAIDELTKTAQSLKTTAPLDFKIKIATAISALGLICALSGGVVGAYFFSHTFDTPNDKLIRAAGSDVMKLTAEQRVKVHDYIEKLQQQ